MKIWPVMIIIIIFGALLTGYFTQGFKQVSKTNPSLSANTNNLIDTSDQILQSTVSADIPPDWKVYQSPNGYSIAHPVEMKTDTMAEGERFYKLGPTQSTGTELYDGISLLIRTGDLANLSLKQLVDQKHQQLKNEETTRDISDPTPKNYGTHSAIQFRQSSLGEGEFIYLETTNGKYMEIINLSAEPNNEQTYQKIVEQMISSITY